MQPIHRNAVPVAGYENGAAYIDGHYMPIADAAIPVTDAGYRRSDVTYDVVSVTDGNFFRLADHLSRFRKLRGALRMHPAEKEDHIPIILNRLIADPRQFITELRAGYCQVDDRI